MRISLQQIETFYWVARLGGFHAAARHQHLTQPTISARIQELEEHLGVRLFERRRSRSGLTPAGRDALATAEKLLKLADNLEQIGKHGDPLKGLLRLGANESIAHAGLADLLTQLKMRYPQMKIELTIDLGVALGRKLGARELDVAILNDSTDAPHVVETAIDIPTFTGLRRPDSCRTPMSRLMIWRLCRSSPCPSRRQTIPL